MRLNEEMMPLEQEWGRRLMAHKPGPCLEAEELVELAEVADMSALSAENRVRMDHVVMCPTCRSLLLELRDVEALRQAVMKPDTPWRSWLAVRRQRIGLTGAKSQRAGDDTGLPPVQERAIRRTPATAPSTRFALGGILAAAVALSGMSAFRAYRTSLDLATTRQQLQHEGTELAATRRERQGLLERLALVQDTNKTLSAESRRIAEENREALTPDDRQVVQHVLRTKRIDMPQPLQIAFAPEVSRDTDLPRSLTLNEPVNTVVMSDAPTFSWQPVNGATKYTFVVTEDQRNPTYHNNFIIQKDLRGTGWQLPPGRLMPGTLYTWQVTAYQNDNKDRSIAQAMSRFKVADCQTLIRLAAAQERYRKRPLDLGILDAQAGVFDESARQFRSVLSSPASSADRQTAKELLTNLDHLRHQYP